jgi:hypothetical protein
MMTTVWAIGHIVIATSSPLRRKNRHRGGKRKTLYAKTYMVQALYMMVMRPLRAEHLMLRGQTCIRNMLPNNVYTVR